MKTAPSVILVSGSVLFFVSLFFPWWSLNSTLVNGRISSFSFQITPTGFGISTPVGNAADLLEPLAIGSLVVGILELPVSASLVLGTFNGVYCVVRRRTGARLLVAPFWGTIALSWWSTYFITIYGFFGSLGLKIPPTGSASLAWRQYTLASATWGWNRGLWLAVAGTILMIIGALWSIRGAGSHVKGNDSSFSLHSYLLFLLAFLNAMLMLALFVALRSPGAATSVALPVIMLIAMGFFARHPRVEKGGRTDAK